MPMKPNTHCPRCGGSYQAGRGCPNCNKRRRVQYEHQPDRAADRAFYASKPWREFRRAVLMERMFCEGDDCKAQGRTTPAEHLHHVKPRSTHPFLSFDGDNVQPLCLRCHSALEARLRGGVGR